MNITVSAFVGESPKTLKLETRPNGSVIGSLMPEIMATKFADQLVAERGSFGKMFCVEWAGEEYPYGLVLDDVAVHSIFQGECCDGHGDVMGPARMIRRPSATNDRYTMLVAVLPRE